MNRQDAIDKAIWEVFPNSKIRTRQYTHVPHTWDKSTVVRYIDCSLQEIGGPSSEEGVQFWEEKEGSRSHFISDFDLPAPRLLTMSQAIHLFRYIEGLN